MGVTPESHTMGVTTESPIMEVTSKSPIMDTKTPKNVKLHLVWTNIIVFTIFHLIALNGLYLLFTGKIKVYTAILDYIIALMCHTGLAVGAHRLFSHRAFKAKAPLRFLLVLMNTFVWESSIIMWARDHRTHHKFTDTNADPHNVTRGIFFSHMGWIMVKRHPDVIAKGKGIDLSDLYSDPILRFQHKYYFLLMPVACFILPVVIPMYFWQETFTNAFCLNFVRYLLVLHNSLAINSVAHRYGNKTYDRFIKPTDCLNISALTLGEGFHNYHHTFPWDYKSAELGTFCFNVPRNVIEFFAKIGWAYDLRTTTEEMIKSRATRTGDGSHPVWGWGDKDQLKEDFKTADILNKEHEY